MAVSVQFEIGHTAKLRAKKTPEGFTHDWDLYVRGTNKSDISVFVERVVFNLHESFQRPKRVIKEPPYIIHESGYAGFILNIDIYFRNRDEPKRVQYTYDLDLQNQGPPHHRFEEKKFIFENPSEEFRQKLLKGGGVPAVPAGLTGTRNVNANILPANSNEQCSLSNARHQRINSTSDSNSTKKHKSRIDDTKLNTFANLFGTVETGIKNTSNIASKPTSECFKMNSILGSGRTYSPISTIGTSSNNVAKEKSSKEAKEKSSVSGNNEKPKDKMERKEKLKSTSNSSPSKEMRSENKKFLSSQSADGQKLQKHSDEKPKKDKPRDKERDRSRSEQSSNNSTNSTKFHSAKNNGSTSAILSSSIMPHATSNAVSNSSSVQRPSPSLPPQSVLNRSEEKRMASKPEKGEKSDNETKNKQSNSSGSGKKSKKKDKDKDRDKYKERNKEKRNNCETKPKDERVEFSTLQSNTNKCSSEQNLTNTNNTLPTISTTLKPKKSEKESKQQDSLKNKCSNLAEKSTHKQEHMLNYISHNATSPTTSTSKEKKNISAVNNASNSSSNQAANSTSANKTHKHKKKEKNREKDKDRTGGSEKEKDRSKEKNNKEKLEQKCENEKVQYSPKTESTSPDLKKTKAAPKSSILPSPSPSSLQTNNNMPTSVRKTTIESPAQSKKSQNKEKKAKNSKSSKDTKKRSGASAAAAAYQIHNEPKSKICKTGTTPPSYTAGSNIELSDADSRQSLNDTNKLTSAVVPTILTTNTHSPGMQSDNSYSNFSGMLIKQNDKSDDPPSSISTKGNNFASSDMVSKENKLEKDSKSIKSSEKAKKSEKDENKRRRNSQNASSDNNTFIEPPIKQLKKESNKSTTRESTKSPLLRCSTYSGDVVVGPPNATNANSARKNTKTLLESNMQNVEAIYGSAVTAAPPNAAVLVAAVAPSSSISNVTDNLTQKRTALPSSSSPSLNNEPNSPNLNELQELHRKIMTLQDNDDLQQVVEMIAASGCYELTQRTFDFDLCKLDRSTVERLQEFFATSVT